MSDLHRLGALAEAFMQAADYPDPYERSSIGAHIDGLMWRDDRAANLEIYKLRAEKIGHQARHDRDQASLCALLLAERFAQCAEKYGQDKAAAGYIPLAMTDGATVTRLQARNAHALARIVARARNAHARNG